MPSGLEKIYTVCGVMGSLSQWRVDFSGERVNNTFLHPEGGESLNFSTQECCGGSTTEYIQDRLIDHQGICTEKQHGDKYPAIILLHGTIDQGPNSLMLLLTEEQKTLFSYKCQQWSSTILTCTISCTNISSQQNFPRPSL